MTSLSHPARRPDIDGLRAIAVLSVLAFHAFPQQVPWGFIGVDFFFVISGYLITTILLENLASGRFTFGEFYERRVRRIFPALIVVLVACLFAGWFVQDPQDYAALGRHVAGGGAFLANVLLWRDSGYFDAAAATKPLLHLWSLGIEEQFYIAWPLLLWLARDSRRGTFALCVLLPLASFGFGLVEVHRDPVAAFYSPLPRAWELLAGAALAWAVLHRARWLGVGVSARSALALACFAAGAYFIHEKRAFPGAWALLPVASAFLWISAPGAWINRRVLAAWPLVAVGLISYPLYLWHWPLLAFANGELESAAETGTRVAVLALAFILAWATWRWVETPLRFGPRGRTKALVLGMAMVAIVAAGCLAVKVSALRFPELGAKLADVKFDILREWRLGTCFLDDKNLAADIQDCEDRYGPRTLLLWGDSHAAHLYPGLRSTVGGRYDIVQRTMSACPPIVGMPKGPRKECEPFNARVLEEVRRQRPRMIVLAAGWDDGVDYRALEIAIRELRAIGVEQVVLVGPFPFWTEPVPRLVFRRWKSDPLQRLPRRLVQGRVTVKDAMEPVLERVASATGSTYFSPRAALCDREGCLAFVPGTETLVAWDEGHLTAAGSRYVAERLPIR